MLETSSGMMALAKVGTKPRKNRGNEWHKQYGPGFVMDLVRRSARVARHEKSLAAEIEKVRSRLEDAEQHYAERDRS